MTLETMTENLVTIESITESIPFDFKCAENCSLCYNNS